MYTLPQAIADLIDRGAVFYVSHSAGKDSQAMYARLQDVLPADRLVVVHADLGWVEWPGIQKHIRDNVRHPVHIVRAAKTFLGMVESRGMWPSSSCRQCTSDLKRDPIMKFIRADLKARGASIAVNCTGIRAAESKARAKKQALTVNKRETVDGRVKRTVYDWLPIFDLSTEEVFRRLKQLARSPSGPMNGMNAYLVCSVLWGALTICGMERRRIRSCIKRMWSWKSR